MSEEETKREVDRSNRIQKSAIEIAGHWEYLEDGKWKKCTMGGEKIEEHLDSRKSPRFYPHRFVEHEHLFNRCECGEVKSE